MELAAVIVALLLLGSLIPSGHTLPQEIAALRWGQRLDLPYLKEEIKMMHRICATWRVEPVPPRNALTQHFEVIQGTPPYYQTRKLL